MSDWYEAIEKAIAWGGSVGDMRASDAFNVALEHVAVLLEDACASYHRGSLGTAVFLAITAIEETSKAELINFRARGGDGQPKKGRDPLRNHATKHLMAVRETTFMGKLPGILGKEVCERLQAEAATGVFNSLRETALYVHADENGVRSPAMEISKERAREILLVALEAADDSLVGGTNRSMILGERFEELIAAVA